MPQVSRAQTVNLKYQSTWPTKDIFHEFAVGAIPVNDMTGGRMRMEVLAAGAVVRNFSCRMLCILACSIAGHGVCAYWYGRSSRHWLFGTPPSYGWDAHSMLSWHYYGGGEAL